MPNVILVVDQGFANSFNARFAQRNQPGETREKTFTVPVFVDVGAPGPPSFQPYGFWCQWNMTDADWADFLLFLVENNFKVNDPNGADISYYFADEFTSTQVLADLTRKDKALLVDTVEGPSL
jgi:hypothetical protein